MNGDTQTTVSLLSDLNQFSRRRRRRLKELEEEEQFFEKLQTELQSQKTVDDECHRKLKENEKLAVDAVRAKDAKINELALELESMERTVNENKRKYDEELIKKDSTIGQLKASLANTTATLSKQRKQKQETSQVADALKADLEKTKLESEKYQAMYMREINRLKLELERAHERMASAESVAAMAKLREMEQLRERCTELDHVRQELEEKVRTSTVVQTKTEPNHVTRLQELYAELSQKISAKTVAAKMFQRDALTLKELESIQCSRSPSEAAETLLNVLLQQPCEVYESFLEALKQSNQQDVYLWLAYKDYSIDVAHTTTIRQHYVFLMDTLDTKYSLLIDHLYAEHVIDLGEKEDITAEESLTRRNEKLLSVLSRTSAGQFGQFLEALDKTGQGHITDVVVGRTVSGIPEEEAEKKLKETTVGLGELQRQLERLGEESRLLKEKNTNLQQQLRRTEEEAENSLQLASEKEMHLRSAIAKLEADWAERFQVVAGQVKALVASKDEMIRRQRGEIQRQWYRSYTRYRELMQRIESRLHSHATINNAAILRRLHKMSKPPAEIKELCSNLETFVQKHGRKYSEELKRKTHVFFPGAFHQYNNIIECVDVIMDRAKELSVSLNATSVAVELFRRGCLRYAETMSILQARSHSKATKSLLTIVLNEPVDLLACMLDCVRETNQDDSCRWLTDLVDEDIQTGRQEDAIAQTANLIAWLPADVLKSVLLKAAMMPFAVTVLCSVSRDWWNVIPGRDWTRRQLLRHLRPAKLLQALPYGEPPAGITQLGNEVYLLREKTTQHIEVYDVDSLSLKRYVTVVGLRGPLDMTSCEHYRYLYISNYGNACVHRVDITMVVL